MIRFWAVLRPSATPQNTTTEQRGKPPGRGVSYSLHTPCIPHSESQPDRGKPPFAIYQFQPQAATAQRVAVATTTRSPRRAALSPLSPAQSAQCAALPCAVGRQPACTPRCSKSHPGVCLRCLPRIPYSAAPLPSLRDRSLPLITDTVTAPVADHDTKPTD